MKPLSMICVLNIFKLISHFLVILLMTMFTVAGEYICLQFMGFGLHILLQKYFDIPSLQLQKCLSRFLSSFLVSHVFDHQYGIKQILSAHLSALSNSQLHQMQQSWQIEQSWLRGISLTLHIIETNKKPQYFYISWLSFCYNQVKIFMFKWVGQFNC